MQSACLPAYRKCSAIAQPAYGAMNLIGAASSAGAATMIVLSSAPASSSVCASPTTVDMRWPIATYTEMMSLSLLLMIASIAIAVLPVWRSPMISSRCPRPIGIIPSIALSPVWSGSFTGWRWTTPGALNSAGRVSDVSMSPLPSSGLPSGSTMRPSRPSPTGISSRRFVRLTVSPSTMCSQGPNSTAPTLSDSRLSARPVTSWGNSSISNDMQFSRPWTRAMPSATDRTVPTSARSASSTSSPSMRLLRMEVISSDLICTVRLVSLDARHVAAQLVESVADRRVEQGVAAAGHDAADDVGVDVGVQLDLLARLLADPVADPLDDVVLELDGGGHVHGEELVLLGPELVVGPPDAVDDRHPVVVEQHAEEVAEAFVRVVQGLVEAVLLLLRREVRGEEEQRQVAGLLDGLGELRELLLDLVELVLLLGDREQRARVDLGDLLH